MSEMFNIEKSTVSPQKPLSFHADDGFETYVIDESTIGVRPKWISVDIKLPKSDTLCVVSCGAAGYHLAQYDDNGSRHHWIPIYGGCSFNSILRNLQYITHWMPLPSTESIAVK